MRYYILLVLLALFSCKGKGTKTEPVKNTEINKLSEVEEVTAAVGALLPSPNAFQLKRAKKWHDASGESWLVLYETGAYIETGKTNTSAKLSAVLYQKTDSGFVQKWKMNDSISNCELDITCSFYDYHLSITDLDSNGIAEIILVYALSCKGDVSPHEKKLILYEGANKYAIRGQELMILQKDTIGGTMNIDPAFSKAPAVFLSFAKNYWGRFGLQKYE